LDGSHDTRRALPAPITHLTADEAAGLDALVARVEAATGVQVVPAIAGKSDSYAEIPWSAFALGVSLASLALALADYLRPAWVTTSTLVLHAVAVLGSGATLAALTILLPACARPFLRRTRADAEVRQFAESLFLRQGIFATRARTGLLLFVSLFERRIEIVADTGLNGRIGAADWNAVIARMTPHLRGRQPFAAMRDALTELEALLVAKGFTPAPDTTNELPNRTIEEAGE
jgi:putative membrane protein